MYFLTPLVAEKMLVSLYMVLFPLAVRYAVRSIRPKAMPLAFLALPLVYNYLFAQGFYNFCLSIAVFFFIIGYWIRNRDRLAARGHRPGMRRAPMGEPLAGLPRAHAAAVPLGGPNRPSGRPERPRREPLRSCMHTFVATLASAMDGAGDAWTRIAIPADVASSFGSTAMVKVRGGPAPRRWGFRHVGYPARAESPV